jgi:hypothetical protein
MYRWAGTFGIVMVMVHGFTYINLWLEEARAAESRGEKATCLRGSMRLLPPLAQFYRARLRHDLGYNCWQLNCVCAEEPLRIFLYHPRCTFYTIAIYFVHALS